MEEEPKKKIKLVEVRIISANLKTALAEHGYRRAYIPTAELKDGKVAEDIFNEGVRYGVPWEQIKLIAPKAEDLAKFMTERGIWTEKDLVKNPGIAQAAIQHLLGINISAVFKLAEDYKEA